MTMTRKKIFPDVCHRRDALKEWVRQDGCRRGHFSPLFRAGPAGPVFLCFFAYLRRRISQNLTPSIRAAFANQQEVLWKIFP